MDEQIFWAQFALLFVWVTTSSVTKEFLGAWRYLAWAGVLVVYHQVLLKRLAPCPFRVSSTEFHRLAAIRNGPYAIGLMWLVGVAILGFGVFLATQMNFLPAVGSLLIAALLIWQGVAQYLALAKIEVSQSRS